MMWAAGQKRSTREGRERMTEQFMAARDGYLAAYLGDKMKPPDYTKPEAGTPRARKGLSQLMADFGGVERGAVPGKFQN